MEKVPQIVSERLRTATSAKRAAEHPPSVDHPEADVLTAFAEKSLTQNEQAQVMDHLALCSDCRDVLALALPATESVEQIVAPSRGGWFSWPVLRWGFAAAGLAVIATFGVVQYQRHSQPEASPIAKLEEQNTPAVKPSNVAAGAQFVASNSPVTAPAAEPRKKMAVALAPRLSVPRDSESKSDQIVNGQVQTFQYQTGDAASAPGMMARTAPTPRAALHGGVRSGAIGGATAANANSAFGPKMPTQWQQNTVNNMNAAVMPAHAAQGAAASADVDARAKNTTVLVNGAAQAVEVSAGVAGPEPTVEGRNLQLLSENNAAPKVSDKDAESLSKAKPAQSAQSFGGPIGVTTSVPRWAISSTGGLQRSVDQGRTWQDVDVTANLSASAASELSVTTRNPRAAKQSAKALIPSFRAVTANGAEVWAGGRAGLLYHSADGGSHWTRVVPTANGTALTDDIVGVEFSDTQHGVVSTASSVWITTDGGQSWRKQ